MRCTRRLWKSFEVEFEKEDGETGFSFEIEFEKEDGKTGFSFEVEFQKRTGRNRL